MPNPKPDPKPDPNIKAARAEIEAVLKRHDLAGFVSLHGAAGWGEVFWNIWPSYSNLVGDFPVVRITSKAADYAGREALRTRHRQLTAQMVHHIATSTGQCAMQFLYLAEAINAAFGAEHQDLGIVPDPSKHNPGTH